MVQLSHPCMTTGKTIALSRQTFVGKVMSLLFKMLSSFAIAFLPRSRCLLISWLQSPSAVLLEPKKIKSVTVSIFSPIYLPWFPKGNQSWIFIGRADAEAEAPIIWPCDAKNWLIGKDSDAGKDWRQEEKGQQMMRWLDGNWLNGHELEQAPGVGDGQGSLACCSPWDHKESDTTEWLNWLNSL